MADSELTQSFQEFNDFVTAVVDRNIRSVKLADYGFVEPEKTKGGAIVMSPKVRLVATAIDKEKQKLLRWEETHPASSTVTIHAGSENGTHGEARVEAKRETLRETLEFQDIVVQKGEWKPETVSRLLSSA